MPGGELQPGWQGIFFFFLSLEEEMKMQRKEGLALLQTHKNNKAVASPLARLHLAEPKQEVWVVVKVCFILLSISEQRVPALN